MMENAFVLAAALLWALIAVIAVTLTAWAIVAKRTKEGASTLALCLWCTVAGGTLTSGMWAWMTLKNHAYQYEKIAKLAPDSTPKDVDLDPMAMLKFYVKLDEFGRKRLYLTVLVPFLFSIFYFRSAHRLPAVENTLNPAKDELFGPEM